MRQLESTLEQQRSAEASVAARIGLDPQALGGLAYLADADESLMEEALRPSCETGRCNVDVAEQILCMRLANDD